MVCNIGGMGLEVFLATANPLDCNNGRLLSTDGGLAFAKRWGGGLQTSRYQDDSKISTDFSG